jgi:Protein of unknown function (DUF559)/Transcriptional regulator, AbiEi antitoxin
VGSVGDLNVPELWRTRRFAGVVTTDELTAAGVTRQRLRSLLRSGVLAPVCYGAYCEARQAAQVLRDDPARERLLLVAAAVALAGQSAVASHEDAATVHSLALLDRPSPSLRSVSIPPSPARGRRRRPDVHVHTAALPEAHIRYRDGIPVTSVARTVVDLARTLPFRSGVVVADSALHGFHVGKAELESVARDCARWPGIARARRVIAFSDVLAESPFESIARVAFRDGGLPPPMLQVWIMAPDRPIGRVDFLWDQHATIAEADGAMKYADPDRARQQLKRDAELRRAGYEVVHFTWRDLMADPDQVIGWIRAAFGRSARLRAAR